jgi:hypothetical protein
MLTFKLRPVKVKSGGSMNKVVVSVGTGLFVLDTVCSVTAGSQGFFLYSILFAGFAVLMALIVLKEKQKA